MKRAARTFLRNGWIALALLAGLAGAVSATNLTGTFKLPDGSPVNGKLIFRLSQSARLLDNSAQIVPIVKIFPVENGQVESGAFIYGNDALAPSGTYYLVRLVDSQNNLLFEQKWSIQGTNLDLGTLTPTTISVLLPNPLILNTINPQAIQGPVTFGSPVTALSLTLNGNLSPGAAATYDLGSATTPWKAVHAVQWNDYITPGPVGGLVTPPSSAPVVAQETTTGGAIADGTYYLKYTYGNKNGETLVSPVQSVNVTAGPGTAQVRVGFGTDGNWSTGAYKFRVYAANNVNGPFFAQTPRSLSFGTSATVGPATITSIARSKGTVTVSTSPTHGFSAGWPVTITGITGDTSFNATTVIKAILSTTQFTVFIPGADGSGTTGGGSQASSYGVIRSGNKVWVRTGSASTFTIAQQIVLSGFSDSSFNGTFRVWDTPSSPSATGQFAVVFKQTGSDANSSGGTVKWPSGIDTNWHHIGQDGYAIFDVLTFSGTQAPAANTAVIDPVQVALNAGRTATTGQGAANIKANLVLGGSSALFVPAITLTTPLIVSGSAPNILGSYHAAGDNHTTTFSMPSVSDPEVGVVMFMGGDTYMNGVSIVAAGDTNAIMDMAYANNRVVENFVAKTGGGGSSDYAAAIRFYNKDESHNYSYRNFVLWGARAGVMATNAGIYNFVFEQGRINCGTTESSSAFLHDGGPTAPDIGANFAVHSVFDVEFRYIDTEVCKGPAFDVKNGVLSLYKVANADASFPGGVDATAIRMRTNQFSRDVQEGLFITNSEINGDANAWSTVFYEGANSLNGIIFYGNKLSASGALSTSLDLRNSKFIRGVFVGNLGLGFSDTASSSKVININPTAFNHLSAFGNFGSATQAGDEISWQSGRIRIAEPLNFANRKTLFMNGNTLETHAANDSTVLHTLDNNGNGAYGGTVQGARLISTISTGTAPLTVTSTTEVANLNAQQWHGKLGIDFSGALDFAAIAAQSCSELTMSVSGAVATNAIAPAWPVSLESGLAGVMVVSAADTVKVRLCNVTAASIDPASQTFAGRIIK